jgi:hypothetical protein
MNQWHTLIPIPNSIIQEAIDCWIIQMKWSAGSVEIRSRQVEVMEHHIAEIVSAIILKEVTKQLKLR